MEAAAIKNGERDLIDQKVGEPVGLEAKADDFEKLKEKLDRNCLHRKITSVNGEEAI